MPCQRVTCLLTVNINYSFSLSTLHKPQQWGPNGVNHSKGTSNRFHRCNSEMYKHVHRPTFMVYNRVYILMWYMDDHLMLKAVNGIWGSPFSTQFIHDYITLRHPVLYLPLKKKGGGNLFSTAGTTQSDPSMQDDPDTEKNYPPKTKQSRDPNV